MGEVIDLRKHRELERRGAELEEVVVGELVDDDDAPIPVNPARELEPRTLHGKVLERAEVKPEPWIAAWLRVPEARRDVVRYYGARSLHACVFHSLRAPIYAGKAAARAPVGTARVAVRTAGWVFDREAAPLRSTAVANDDIGDYLRLAGLRNDRVRLRLSIIGAVALAVVVAAVVGQRAAPHLFALGCALAVFVLGFIGRRRDKPIIGRAVTRDEAPRLTDEVVVQALVALRMPGITAAYREDPERAIRFVSPICRDGKGWRVEVELPPGVKAIDVVDKREELAGALARPLGCVWPEVDVAIHPGRLVLWVGDQAMATSRQAPWPLLKSGTVDLFKPVPFGTNQRNRIVPITLMFASMVVGSVPRVGKTAALRLLLVTAALDPRAQLHVYDLKGTGDFRPLKSVAHRYRAGARDEDVEYLLDDLVGLQTELDRRVKVIDSLPEEAVPDAKITPDLPARHKMFPIVLAIDECFPAGTLIGGRPIERIHVGDIVPSWDQETGEACDGTVTHLFKSRPSGLVRVVLDDGTEFACTPNHPIRSARGWVPAVALLTNDSVLGFTYATKDEIRPISRGPAGLGDVHGMRHGVPDHAVLPGVPLEDDGAVVLLSDLQGCADGPRPVASDLGRAQGHPVRPHEGGQSDARRGDEGAGVGVATGNGTPSARSAGQWSWAHGTAAAIGRGLRVADRGGRTDGAPTQGNSNLLQGRRGESGHADSRGDRRGVPLRIEPAGGRPQEGVVPSWRRVDRIEVLEPGSDGRYGGVCPDGLVYNFEVAGTHTYRIGDGVVVHNCQRAMEHEDHGPAIRKICEDLVRVGPAAGIISIFATQRPDKKSLPTGISGNAILRFCLKVMGQVENDMILGTSSYQNGVRATMFSRKDLGIGYLAGEGEDPMIVRTFYLDAPAAKAVVKRAHAARLAAGTVTGYALGEDHEPDPDRPRWDLLTDILACVGPMEEKVWSCTLLTALAELRPDAYEGWDETTFAKALGAHAVKTIQISKNDDNGVRRNWRGVEIQVVREAAQARGERGSE